jgi:hypothetical protein
MRYVLCAALLCSFLVAQESVVAPGPVQREGIFFVNGVDYHFVSGANCTAVVAAHSVVNRKFLGVKIRIVNSGDTPVTVKPEDIVVQDAMAGRVLPGTSGADLAKKMSKPYNWARLGVKMGAGSAPEESEDNPMDPQRAEMLRMMRQMAGQMGGPMSRSALATSEDGPTGVVGPGAVFSDEVSYLRRREASGPDVLLQLQKQNSPDFLEQTTLLANTIPPRGDMQGVMYYPMGKLTRDPAAGKTRSQSHVVRVTVPAGGESFSFVLAVE